MNVDQKPGALDQCERAYDDITRRLNSGLIGRREKKEILELGLFPKHRSSRTINPEVRSQCRGFSARARKLGLL